MRALLDHIAHPFFASLALLFFVVSFAGIVFWTFRNVKPSPQEPRAQHPLQGDSSHD